VKKRLRLICGSLELNDGPLRTAADLYLPRFVSFAPASRLPDALHQSALCATSRPSPLHPIISSDCDFEPIGDEPPKQMGDRKHPRRLICSTT